ncbi:Scr1 family TA system antitoxin-like transcriptional regulator [Streptomyces sp. NPDC006289]|uniref:Scr1 family TA system antitoxin-like transcriptional regulator n=1 Tax=Streptomyces sp. NPDC006289 TaxID=3156744 RepID=UPI0033A91EE0
MRAADLAAARSMPDRSDLRFADAPDLAYVEGLYTGALTDDPLLVRRYRDAYDLARAAALPPVASLDLLESVAEDYSHACTPDL